MNRTPCCRPSTPGDAPRRLTRPGERPPGGRSLQAGQRRQRPGRSSNPEEGLRNHSIRVRRRPRRASPPAARTLAAIATAALALLAAACGGSSSSNHPAASAQQNGPLAFARCMRANGVPDFPDPGASAPSVNQDTPAFQAALQACHRVSPKQSPPPTHPSASQHRAALRLADCMRAHGISGFPDPTPNPPGPGSGTVLGASNEYFVLGPGTGTDPHSPVFLHAATECGVGLKGAKS